jgi:hypothetical protein
MPRFSLLFAVLLVPLIVGCDGCRNDSTTSSNQQAELSPEDFVAGRPVPYPTDDKVVTSGIKPGHWLTAVQALKSNNADSRGDLNSIAGLASQASNPDQPKTTWSDVQALRNGSIITRRPVVLPKGQNKKLDYRTFAPNLFVNGKAKSFFK